MSHLYKLCSKEEVGMDGHETRLQQRCGVSELAAAQLPLIFRLPLVLTV